MTLPNLIMDEEIIPEFLQTKATPEGIAAKVEPLLDESCQAKMKENFTQVCDKLGAPGACERAASEIFYEISR